jgi:hypothetical protein
MKQSVVAEDQRRAAVLGPPERKELLRLLNKLAG